MSARPWRESVGEGAMLAIAIAPALYALLRMSLRWIAPEADPRAALASERSPMLDRLSLTLYATALVSSATVALARRHPARVSSWLWWSIGASALAVAAQTAVAP